MEVPGDTEDGGDVVDRAAIVATSRPRQCVVGEQRRRIPQPRQFRDQQVQGGSVARPVAIERAVGDRRRLTEQGEAALLAFEELPLFPVSGLERRAVVLPPRLRPVAQEDGQLILWREG